ncbi:MAG: DUF4340 domain-containing protein [Planctomycetes bacterium]|nr:DUF4340 domain-containing protein [Planctomycetota bacterium]
MAKTIAFVAAAAGSLLLAFVVNTNLDQFDVESLVGKRLNEFEVDAAKRLKIVKFDADTASVREFEVASTEGLWTIPSKQGYPADAAQQMAEAATCLIDREVLRVAAIDASRHKELGVIAPTSSNLDSQAEGVGIRVTMTDNNDETLTDMIIGKPVKDAEGQYYVRKIDQDAVFVVAMNPEKLSTRFEDWIEEDLLKLDPADLRIVDIKDYSVEMQQVLTPNGFQTQVGWDRRGEISLRYDEAESKWLPKQLQEFDAEKKEMADYTLAEDEELNSEVLDELRKGLDELLLVDVERKPAGLSADLKAGEGFLKNDEAIRNLVNRGFAPISAGPDGEAEILSSEGEIICTLKDGVEYVLRFGNLKVDGEAASEDNAAEEKAAEDSETGINRYLFVMARFNESMIEKPELEGLPALPEEPSKEKPEEKTEETPAEEAAENTAEEKPTDETPEASGDTEETPADEGDAKETEKTEDTADQPEGEATEEEKPEEQPKDLETIIAERKSIEQENQRRLDEYQDKIKAAQERVQELNERFGDWYYVISNDVYKKLHLDREKLVTKKKQEEAEKQPAALPGNTPFPGS